MNKKVSKLQRMSIIITVAAMIAVSAIVIYSLGFLSNNLLRALRSQVSLEGEAIEFNLKDFEALGL